MKAKKFLSLLLAVALVFTALPATLLAEDVPAQDSGEPVQDSGKTQDGGDLMTLSIDVNGVTKSGATLTFTADADGRYSTRSNPLMSRQRTKTLYSAGKPLQ